MGKICPRCGISSEKRRFAGNFCQQCAPIPALIPDSISIMQCTRCGRIRVGDRWKEERGKDLLALALRESKGPIRNAELDLQTGKFSAIVEQSGAFVELRKNMLVEREKTLCIDCSRAAGGYFEAIIQVRGGGKEGILKKAAKIAEIVGKKSFVAKVIEQKEGIDIYCGSRMAAIGALNSLRLGFVRTEKLAGERDGKRLYRTTLAVRI